MTDMRNDETWKELGTKLQESSPDRRRPSDWWLVVYLAQGLLRKVVEKNRKKIDMESNPDGGEL